MSERQRRKEEAIDLAIARAAMDGHDLRVLVTDEATAQREYDAALDQLLAPMQVVTVDAVGTRVVTIDPHAEIREGLAERRRRRT